MYNSIFLKYGQHHQSLLSLLLSRFVCTEYTDTATDIARTTVCLSVCLSIGHMGMCLQKLLNSSRCRLGHWLMWVQGIMC